MEAQPKGTALDLAHADSETLTAIAAAQPKPSRFHEFPFIAVEDLAYHPPDFLVHGLVETDSMGMIFGESTHGKSFLAIDLALSVGTGSDFHGRATKKGNVLYLAGEGHNGLGRRVGAWEKERQVARTGMFISKKPAQFLDSENAKLVADVVHELAARHGDPALIIVDTLDKNFGSGDENSTADMKDFMTAVNSLRLQFPKCTAIIVHHPGHGDKSRARGGSNLPAGLDLNSRVERQGDFVTWTFTKTKEAELPRPLTFELASVQIAPSVTSLVLREVEAQPKQSRLSKGQHAAREAYISAAAMHGIWDSLGFAGLHLEHWRAAFYAAHCDKTPDARRKAFNRARDELEKLGTISIVDNDNCRWNEPAIGLLISQRHEGGTSGTGRDNVPECPDAEAG